MSGEVRQKVRKSSMRELDLWAYTLRMLLYFPRPGKPMDNAFMESFNRRFRQKWLNEYWFLSLEDATEKIEAWRSHYNEQRPTAVWGIKHRQIISRGRCPRTPRVYRFEVIWRGRNQKGRTHKALPLHHPPALALRLLSSRALSSGRADEYTMNP
jgi:hypothetical protein